MLLQQLEAFKALMLRLLPDATVQEQMERWVVPVVFAQAPDILASVRVCLFGWSFGRFFLVLGIDIAVKGTIRIERRDETRYLHLRYIHTSLA
jgi:hypothetical protein